MIKPLGLPVGSVRALLLLSLAATAVIPLKDGTTPPLWILVACMIAGVSYFSARSAANQAGPADAPPAPRSHPLGLPAGSIRLLVLIALGVGLYFWLEHVGDRAIENRAVWVVAGFAVGILMRFILARLRRPDDLGARFFDHMLAIVSLLAAAGLIVSVVSSMPADTPSWAPTVLGAIVTHYFGAR